jgi:protein tyrosine phosphatase (PTP) superfamily phosphohydrolase (DUF442 family)
MSRRDLLLLPIISTTLALGGCQHTCNRCNTPGLPPGAIPIRPGSPPPAGLVLPPTAVPTVPPAAVPAPAPFPEGSTSGFGAVPLERPATPLPPVRFGTPNIGRAPEVLTPEPTGRAQVRPNPNAVPRLMSPELALPGERTPPPTVPPGEVGSAVPASGLPAFTTVKTEVASGRRPLLDGFDWLRDHGYRSVLHLRRDTDDDASDRRRAEQSGLAYAAMTVTDADLAGTIAEQFDRVVNDPSARPLYVYDRDGTLSGAMWYLHMRRVDRVSDAEARVRAARLGYTPGRDDAEGRAVEAAVRRAAMSLPG